MWKKITSSGIIGCCPWNGFTTFGDQTHSSKMQSRSYFHDHHNHDSIDDHDEHDNCYYYYVFVNECWNLANLILVSYFTFALVFVSPQHISRRANLSTHVTMKRDSLKMFDLNVIFDGHQLSFFSTHFASRCPTSI